MSDNPQLGVPLVSVPVMAALVQRVGVGRFITELADRIEKDFARWPEFDKSPRYAAHSPDGVIELMPVADDHRFAFKYVNGHPKNTRDGKQTVVAFGVLSDVASGYPILLSEMTLLTALRTAASSVLMAKHLAPRKAKTLTLIGNGAQSEFQSLGFHAAFGVEEFRLFDTDPDATAKCARNLKTNGLNVVTCASPEEAVRGADIITTCTADKRNATILTDNMVGSGLHVNAIGGDCPGKTEIHPDVLKRASIFVEYAPQTRIEGDIQQLSPDHPVTEMWRVITGEATGRTSDDQITLFDGVGFAVEDYAALCFVNELIGEMGEIGAVDLLANPEDPKDLFGFAMSRPVR